MKNDLETEGNSVPQAKGHVLLDLVTALDALIRRTHS
jgi:hypothetical protein